MIISASRRTDIPTYYSEWFADRIKKGYVLVRNPMNVHQISRINLAPEVIDGIVFWTKNPIPMIEKLEEFKNYVFYFQFTLNAYGKDIEPNVPSKKDIVIPSFQRLSKMIGKDRIVWRYDPILLNSKYTMKYHIQYFQAIAKNLSGYTDKCIISFLDLYKNTERNTKKMNIIIPSANEKIELMQHLIKIANAFDIQIETCAEDMELEWLGINHASCIDRKRFELLGGYKLNISKDKNQRTECGCFESIDIGAYNTCKNGCLYCYANFNTKIVDKNFNFHNPTSPLINGEVHEDDEIKIRKVYSCKDCQLNFFNRKIE